MRAHSEAAWQVQVQNLATYYGWKHYHAPDNRPVRSASGRVQKQSVVPGFPDLLLIRVPEIVIAELKTDKGRVTPEQNEWLEQFRACGIEAHIWRPKDHDVVVARLTRHLRRAVAA